MTYFRSDLASLPAYIPGHGNPNALKVSSNELPFPTLNGVQAALQGRLASQGRYPDLANTVLIEALAEYHGVPIDHVAVSNGSTAMIEKFLQAVCTPGAEVVTPWRSFEAYPIAIQVAGGKGVFTPLRADGNADLSAVVEAINSNTRAVLLCTPNNPTSAALTHAEVEAFLAEVPAEIPVLLDEAYCDFVQMDDAVDGIALTERFPNVVTLRTFSKAYGLAGLRIGYAVAQPDIIAGLRAVATPFGVNTLAQVAARQALAERSEVDRRVGIINDYRTKLVARLRELGWDGPEPQANFLWFATGENSAAFTELCAAEGIIVRPFAREGVRVTVAEWEAAERLIRAYEKFVAS